MTRTSVSFPLSSATYFTQDGVAGACGTVHKDTDLVCALDTPTYDSGKHCGQTVAITNKKNGKTVNVKVADVRKPFPLRRHFTDDVEYRNVLVAKMQRRLIFPQVPIRHWEVPFPKVSLTVSNFVLEAARPLLIVMFLQVEWRFV